MELKSLEIFEYLKSCEPISKLDNATQRNFALRGEKVYFKQNEVILEPEQANLYLYLIKSGAAQRTQDDGTIVGKFSVRDFFGCSSLKRNGLVRLKTRAIQNSWIYRFPGDLFLELLDVSSYFRFYFASTKGETNEFLQTSDRQFLGFNCLQLKTLLNNPPLLIDHTNSASTCARMMADSNATCLLVTQNGLVKGIVTDREICLKIVADNLSYESPVGLIMSEQLVTLDEDATALQALLTMARNNVRYLLVTASDEIIGIVTANDLIYRQWVVGENNKS